MPSKETYVTRAKVDKFSALAVLHKSGCVEVAAIETNETKSIFFCGPFEERAHGGCCIFPFLSKARR